MAKIILTYRLKPGVTPEAFEDWVRTTDYPAMRGLSRVASFANHRVTGLLMGEGEPGMDYIEIFDVPDLEGFVAQDMPGGVVQGIMGAFMGQVDDPKFILADEVV
ncbi:MAG: REDY-like protein HapK [Sphingomonadales bacterium]|nr:MAG: REDY-like protein HapK [Sphingomonadales bacterium]